MATGPNPLPPTTILSSHSISQSAAHDFLAAYLDRAATDPARQPNAGISEHGPIARTTTTAPNLMLHNLKRIQAGLAGEVLGRDLSLANLDAAGEGAEDVAQQQTGDWEDVQKYEQEENAEDQDAEEPMTMEVDAMEQSNEGAIDKEERKRKKKERRLAEKRAKVKAEADA